MTHGLSLLSVDSICHNFFEQEEVGGPKSKTNVSNRNEVDYCITHGSRTVLVIHD